jgi:chromosome segregation protein
MTGFKSFATKTVVDFRPGVTIVVGPNGCGKSNIFDAIRWVLGEQSAKSLRGTKMGDVIFQGSATYKPMGCAQITLVIDNAGRRLPLDYSEISITRRLYRSGESEYLLNKMPCRLRDIHELFLDTGVGTDTYSAMEQGRVADIVKSRPEDRREIFEQAAGISKYKARKQEALRKLERTEGDLIRLADRVAETTTRRNSLKRQAARAERYKELTEARDGVEKRLLALELAGINERLETVEREFSDSQDALAVVRGENDQVQARREELLLAMQIADETLRDLSMRKDDQRKYIAEISHEVTRLRTRAEAERRRADDMNGQLDELALRASELAWNLAEANIEETRLAARSIALQAEQNVRRTAYDRLRSDSASVRERITALRAGLDGAGEDILRLRNERSRLQLEIEMAVKTVEDFDRQKQEHQLAVARLGQQVDEVREKLDARREELKSLEATFEASKTQALEEMRARDILVGERRTVDQKLSQSRSTLGALERLAKDYEGYYDGVRAVMRASEQHELDGIVGVVPELIQSMDPANDLALEIALGNHVQDIVVRTADDAKRAIEFLKAQGKGRATFLPLDIIEAREPSQQVENVLRRPGVVGLASRLVTYDRFIERAVVNLLGQTVVTDSTDVTLGLVRSGARGRYVTLDGQLTSPGGAMTGGSHRKSQILTRQREISDLTVAVRELTEKEADLATRVAKREGAMANLAAQGEKVRGQIQEMRLEMGRTETTLAALRESRDQRKGLFDDLRAKAESSRGRSEDAVRALEGCDARLGAAQQAHEERRGELTGMEETIYARGAETDRMGEEVNQADREIQALDQQRAHLRERSGAYAIERGNQHRRVAQVLADQQRGRDEARRFDEQVTRVEGERTELEKELAGVDAELDAAAKQKEGAQQALHAEGDRSQRLMSDLTQAQNRYNEAQADHINIQSDLKRLTERARDRFERELAELAAEVGAVEATRSDLSDELHGLREEIARMGDNINMGALVEFREVQEHLDFLTAQQKDLMDARDSLTETIATIDKTTSKMFIEAFEAIRENFIHVYRRLFGGGKADLVLQTVDEGDPLLDAGIEIIAQPPGKKLQNISLLSGGEQALTAVSLMFGIFMYKPSPFCVMDEIDAPLDDANVGRFRDMLREFARNTQFIIITHNKITMELADTLYGITMQETGVSSLVSVAFDQVDSLRVNRAS